MPPSTFTYSYASPKIRAIDVITKHITIPVIVGRRKATTVQRIFWVSFCIVHKVVPQGKCINVKIITQIAVM